MQLVDARGKACPQPVVMARDASQQVVADRSNRCAIAANSESWRDYEDEAGTEVNPVILTYLYCLSRRA